LALDDDPEDAMYQPVRAELVDTVVVSVTHHARTRSTPVCVAAVGYSR
jgi:ABC-type uncharacterized transport system fused permease/ATPase subunit